MEWHFSGICEDLPKSNGKSMVVDRFSKYWHFMTLQHPYTAGQIPKVFLIPYSNSILSGLWHVSRSVQMDKQSQWTRRSMMTNRGNSQTWTPTLTLVEYTYNTGLHSSLQRSPFWSVVWKASTTNHTFVHSGNSKRLGSWK